LLGFECPGDWDDAGNFDRYLKMVKAGSAASDGSTARGGGGGNAPAEGGTLRTNRQGRIEATKIAAIIPPPLVPPSPLHRKAKGVSRGGGGGGGGGNGGGGGGGGGMGSLQPPVANIFEDF